MEAEDVKRALKDISGRYETYRLYTDYYAGNQRMAFATDKMKSLFGALFGSFSDNLCPAVVDAMADKLTLRGLGLDDGENAAVDTAVADVWARNRMDKKVGEVHTEALKTGDSYVIVWEDPEAAGQVVVYPNPADRMTVYYDEERPGTILWAAKMWRAVDERVRLVMYYPDRIEHYVTLSKKQDLSTLKPESFLEHELGVVKNPYGRVPVFHFANNASTGQFGISELRPVVPLQDALNKAITDMLVAMEFVALPQRWVAGVKLKENPITGQYIWPFEAGVDRIWATDDPNSKFGEFPAANLDHFLKVQDAFRLEIARVTRTPLHFLMMLVGQFPSGESLKTAEAPFTAKLRDRQVSFGNVWEDVVAFALQVMGRPLGELVLNAEWEEVEPKSEKDYAETLKLHQELTPPMLKKLGYSDDDIKKITGGAQQVGDALMDAFTNASRTRVGAMPGAQQMPPNGAARGPRG